MVAIFGSNPFLAHFHVFGRETNKRENDVKNDVKNGYRETPGTQI